MLLPMGVKWSLGMGALTPHTTVGSLVFAKLGNSFSYSVEF